VISIAMAAATLEIDRGRVAAARVAVGACSAVAQRLPLLEVALAGAPLDQRLADLVAADHLAPLSPIDDVRASAAYRRDAAIIVLRRLLSGLAS
jgi:CO/xanthine dehydrogenase FAD-binding subunit